MALVVITGGNRGIGLELAHLYAAANHEVILGLRSPGQVADLPGQSLPLDVGSDEAVAAFVKALGGRTVDVLVNNAGILGPQRQSTLDTDFDGFLETLNINTLGPLRVTQALLGNLRRSAAPKVAILSSRMGSLSNAQSNQIAYRASKAAVNKVAQGLATDLKNEAIAVAAIHPGWARTDMGGAGADISPQDSAAGVKAVIDGLSIAETGRFWNYDGSPFPW